MTVEEARSEMSRASKGTMETVEKQQPRSRAEPNGYSYDGYIKLDRNDT